MTSEAKLFDYFEKSSLLTTQTLIHESRYSQMSISGLIYYDFFLFYCRKITLQYETHIFFPRLSNLQMDMTIGVVIDDASPF